MKKVFAVLAVAGMFAFVACGPKAEETSTETTDSAATVEAAPVVEEAAPAPMDSAAAAAPADSAAAAPAAAPAK
jgi:hypothetical protein